MMADNRDWGQDRSESEDEEVLIFEKSEKPAVMGKLGGGIVMMAVNRGWGLDRSESEDEEVLIFEKSEKPAVTGKSGGGD